MMNSTDKLFSIKESVDDLLPRLGQDFIEVHDLEGNSHFPRSNSKRLMTFKHHGTVCVECGEVATHWILTFNEQSDRPYLSLRGKNGLLFTHDHIIPLSKGGTNTLSNTQTMCGPCNWALGAKDEVYIRPVNVELDPSYAEVYYERYRKNWVVCYRVANPTRNRRYWCLPCSSRSEALAKACQHIPQPIVTENPEAHYLVAEVVKKPYFS
jgi:hypothetical protein